MRNITKKATENFYNNKNFKLSNTEIKDGCLYLWGHKIAWMADNELYFCLCGYNTTTTKERLRGLGIPLKQKNYSLYVGNKEINPYDTYKLSDILR